MTLAYQLSDSTRDTIVTGLMAWMALAFTILYVFRNRYCVMCGGRLRFRERSMDANGYDLCDRHHPRSQPSPDHEDDDFDTTC